MKKLKILVFFVTSCEIKGNSKLSRGTFLKCQAFESISDLQHNFNAQHLLFFCIFVMSVSLSCGSAKHLETTSPHFSYVTLFFYKFQLFKVGLNLINKEVLLPEILNIDDVYQ